MSSEAKLEKLLISEFHFDSKEFALRTESDADIVVTIKSEIRLEGIVNGLPKTVNVKLDSSEYLVYRFVNPYLNAQNDSFRLKYLGYTIGYAFPSASIEDFDDDFDVFKQAYKYYCAKLIIENHDFYLDEISDDGNLKLSDILDENSVYFIIFKKSIKDDTFNLENCLPSLALKGYYLYSNEVVPNILNILDSHSESEDLNTLLELHYHSQRAEESIQIHKSTNIEENLLIRLLYKKLLIENSNPIYRFLVLYQVIEFLVEKNKRLSINNIFDEKDSLNNYDFFDKISKANNTRAIINKLLQPLTFDSKALITQSLLQFIYISIDSYPKTTIGDCLYDIRNLLFHDYKNVMEVYSEDSVLGLVIQCEIIIHNLINLSELN